jgi:YidC/Oxa1 family membrane protein insertase
VDPTAVWNSFIVIPLTELIRFLQTLLGNYGLAIIAFTVVARLVMFPLTMQQLKSSKAMQELQPEIQALQKRYGKDKEGLSKEQMKLYQERGINPLAGCLPMLIQMPIWIGLYSALLGLSKDPAFASSFLWIENIAQNPSTSNPVDFVLPVLTVVSQWAAQRMMTPAVQDPQQKSMNSMMQIMPLMFGWFAFQVPAGLVLYWTASNVFSMVQQYFITGWGSLANLLPKQKAAATYKGTAGSTGTTGTKASQGFVDSLRNLAPPPSAGPRVDGRPDSTSGPKIVQRFDPVEDSGASPDAEKRKPKRK